MASKKIAVGGQDRPKEDRPREERPREDEHESENMGQEKARLIPFSRETLSFDDIHDKIPTGVWIMGAPIYWDKRITGKGVTVGVIDTGIDDSHPDLAGKVTKRYDYVRDGLRPSQFNLHGTHVAGTIAANGSIKGVAPDAKLIDYRVLDADGSGSFQAITQAIKQSAQDGCNIINLSLGGPSDYPPMHQAISDAVSKGVLVVVAAGNEGEDAPPPNISFPANYAEVVCVGAVDFEPRQGKIIKIGFSNQSAQVDVAADGFKVVSTVPRGRYEELSGTSMASPHVAGFCALLLQKLRTLSPGMRTELIEPTLWAMLKDNTVDVLSKGLDWSTGAGFVTGYPALPVRDSDGKWIIPGMTNGQPL